MKRIIIAASSSERSELFDTTKSNLEDNFAYALDGIDKIARDGQEKLAVEIMNELNAAVESATSRIADAVAH